MHDSASGAPQHFTKDFCRSITAETMLTEGNRQVCGSIAVFYMLMKVSSKSNRGFPEITGENNLTVFSYSGRVKSPEWRWQRRRADLQHFEFFRPEPIIVYTRLPAGGTYYPICKFSVNSECLIGISDAFSAFCLRVSVILPTCSLYPQQKCDYSVLHPQAWTYIYRSMPEGSYRVQSPGFPKIVYYSKGKMFYCSVTEDCILEMYH